MEIETTISKTTNSRAEQMSIEIKPKEEATKLIFNQNFQPLNEFNTVPFDTVKIRGLEIHAVSRAQTVDHLIDCSVQNIGGWVVTPNLDILRRYTRSASFRNLVATSTLMVPDGMPLVWASRVKGQPLPERVNGTDLVVDLCEAAAKVGQSVFFLGGNPGSAEKTIESMTDSFPDLMIAGSHCPEFGFENDVENIEEIARILAAAEPDIVFVGLGSPKQDVLVNLLRLRFPGIWWLGIGISFSFIAGELPRAPEWAKRSGFEWLYRLFSEPQRLAKRYLVQGLPFFAITLLICGFERLWIGSHNGSSPEERGPSQTCDVEPGVE